MHCSVLTVCIVVKRYIVGVSNGAIEWGDDAFI